MSLPYPANNQAYCDVSVLEAGVVGLPLKIFIDTAPDSDEVLLAPSLSFLVQNVNRTEKFLFDLGIRKDWHNLPPSAIALGDSGSNFTLEVTQDVVESLAKGGLSPIDIDFVCLSHCHFDHVGNTKLFPTSKFVVGSGVVTLFKPGYPEDPSSSHASDLLPPNRSIYLSPDAWGPIGPFPRGFDFYGDGSLYIVDAAGHYPGHINLLVRTSADGSWVFLGGDSAHHWSLVTDESKIATVHGCAHVDKEASEKHLACIRRLLEESRVRVLLAHDEPWYRENKAGSDFWPGKLQPV